MIRKCTAKFYIKKRDGIATNCQIVLSFSFEGKRMLYYVGYSVDEKNWNKDSQRVKDGFTDKNGETSKKINKHLNKVENTVEAIYNEFAVLKKAIRISNLRDELRIRLDETIREDYNLNLLDYFAKFIEANKDEWKAATKQKKERVREIIGDFHNKYKIQLDFEAIDETYFKKYIKYAATELKHKNSNIAKYLSVYKGFLNWAFENGFNRFGEYKKFSVEAYFKGVLIPSDSIALSKKEVMILYNYDFKSTVMQQTRDIFCFGCFTGLRFSDLHELKKVNIKNEYIKLTTVKGNKEITVDLNKYTKAILQKYKDLPLDKCLPVPHNAILNKNLKDMGQEVKFDDIEEVVYFKGKKRFSNTCRRYELITTHTARRTFITTALIMNIPAQVIMKWTGHSDYKSFEGYIKISEEERRNAMKKFNDW
ncbi:MAG: tyrosine-type recombinase/integrase [Bacteroidetes bacterium]|nr:tyrosine-type recombinase/integrase [Bacteroidota bacterium]MBT3935534.1 tyrosine-type recombinase/integrase [Bacteroidota bacterium]MBT4728851.1 tyrosine-type recombinase/integrase [Bacteroidota bacterium]MBT5992361.1 tyrosine-type recombinase/integrase [Bacteroidota bacterium]MBT7994788.1 tyrosine-type recombinase/integrase [Bacteroidota bacterium]